MDISFRGRGMGAISNSGDKNGCLCYRPRCFVLCTNCGYHIWGRVRHTCPVHPMTVFLIDLTQCPQCRAFEPFMSEFGECAKNA